MIQADSQENQGCFEEQALGSLATVDLDMAASRYGDATAQLFQMFLSKTPVDMCALKNLVESQDAYASKMSAHRIKGSCSTLFVNEMRNTCILLERAISENNWSLCINLISQLQIEFEKVREVLADVSFE